MVGVALGQLIVVASDSLVGGPYVAFTLTSIGIAVVVAPTAVVWLCVAVLEVGYLAGVLVAHAPGQLAGSGELAGVLGQLLAYPFAALALLGLAVLFRRFATNTPAILEGIPRWRAGPDPGAQPGDRASRPGAASAAAWPPRHAHV